MGAGDSKLSFKKGVFRLAEETAIPANDPYWLSFWELPETAEDVFTLFSAADIRGTRDNHLENLETLLLAVTSRLFALRRHRAFPDLELAPERHMLNCIRVLTRVLPFIYESEKLEEWNTKFFWSSRRKKMRRTSGATAEVLFDEADPDADERRRQEAEGEYEDARPLMEELIDTLTELLFFAGFTLPASSASGKSKVTFTIWQSGVGCNTPVGTTKEGENNKTEILRLLLAITSKAMYIPAHKLPVVGERALTYMVGMPEKRSVLSVLCSLMNTTLKYNPASWRVPYDHIVFTDPRQVLVTYSLQMLLVLLLYPVPDSCGSGIKNNYRHYLGRLHRTQDFQFCVDGMTRILNQPIQATTSYLPGSQKMLKWAPEMMMLFWEALQCNRRFRNFIIDTDRVHDFVVLIVYYALEHRLDPSKSGVVRMCVFVLQTLSTEAKFGKSLNKRFEGQSSLPANVRIPSFSGSYTDYLIISIYTLITTSKGRLSAVYPALLAVIANVAPHIQHLSSAASTKLIQLFTSMSAPGFLLANDTNHTLLHSLLESMNAIIEHQYSANANFVYAVVRSHKRFEALRNFTLEAGQEEIDREARLRKDRGDSSIPASPKLSMSSDRPTPQRRPSTEVPASPGVFEIGDSEDESSDDDKTPSTPSGPPKTPTSPPPPQPPTSPRTNNPEDAVPFQLRGMSEKARGKLPAHAFHRQGSTTSLSSHHSTPGTATASPDGSFAPTAEWLETWLPHLPLHTIMAVIYQLSPYLSSPPPSDANNNTTMLERIRTTELLGIEPTPVKTHMFEWSPMALGWYESLLWGFVYVSERQAGNSGTVGIWNGTAVKLFKVQETQKEGPSLLAPRGGVDAIGTTLVERLGSVRLSRSGGEGGGANGGENGSAQAGRGGSGSAEQRTGSTERSAVI